MDQAPGPHAAAQARDELHQVLRALGKIPDHEREVLLMATVEGLSHQAIAVALDLSVEAVKVRVHRARVRLNTVRAEMEDHSCPSPVPSFLTCGRCTCRARRAQKRARWSKRTFRLIPSLPGSCKRTL